MQKRVRKHRHGAKLNPICKSFVHKGFTLVELLVVIAIIGILASMLLPALSKAKNKAQSAACINQLKQLGVYLQFYVDDNKDFYMHYYDGPKASSGTIWMRCVAEYDQKLNNAASAMTIDANNWGKQMHCFICPTATMNPDTEIYKVGSNNAWYTAYAMNASNTFIRHSTIKSPSKKIMLVDSAHYAAYPPWASAPYTSSSYWPHFRHDNSANALYCDGHADSIRQGFVVDTPPTSNGLSSLDWALPIWSGRE